MRIAAIILLMSSVADAGTLAAATSKSGGTINLTDEKCSSDDGTVFAYIKEEDGHITMGGCYSYIQDDGTVLIKWNDNTVYSYPVDAFQFTAYGTQKYKNEPQQQESF